MTETTTYKTARRARVKATDPLKNPAYIHHDGDRWKCTLANGIPAALFYAGVLGDETALRFRLDDCESAEEVLTAVRDAGSRRYEYELV